MNFLPQESLLFDQKTRDPNSQLNVISVTKSYNGRGAVLSDISFNVPKGSRVALIGGNGSGKSTIVRCCLRLIEPDHGKIIFLTENLVELNKAKLRGLRSRVGMIYQHHNLVPRLSVLSNVLHGAVNRSGSLKTWRQSFAPRQIREKAMECLEKVGLPHLAGSRSDELSGGESQRVAIARVLMQKPDFMIADEPAASLDPKVGREVMELFVALNKQENITFLFVTHDLDHALEYSDQLLGLQKGKMIMNDHTKMFTKGNLNALYN